MPKTPNYPLRRTMAVAIPAAGAHLAAATFAGSTGLPVTAPILTAAAATYGLVKMADYANKKKHSALGKQFD